MDIDFFRLSAKSARTWRNREIHQLRAAKCEDLSYRPSTGMSSLGWVLAHQAAIFDFVLNGLIRHGPPKDARLFGLYTSGTRGDWDGTSLVQLQEYYDSCEKDLLDWIDSADERELASAIKEGTAPSFFVGMAIREVLTTAFAHLNYHTGHLTAIRRDWERTRGQ